MEYIIDTSTWVSLIRYYNPFDTYSVIYDFFKRKIENKEFVLINEVSVECSYVSSGIVTKELDFIKDKKLIKKTVDILPSKKFYNLLENQFCNTFQRRSLQDFEIENLTESFIKSADAKIIMNAISGKKDGQEIIVVTEETITNNDNKLFKKIPAMCSAVDIKCVSLPELIKKFDEEILIAITNACA